MQREEKGWTSGSCLLRETLFCWSWGVPALLFPNLFLFFCSQGVPVPLVSYSPVQSGHPCTQEVKAELGGPDKTVGILSGRSLGVGKVGRGREESHIRIG